MSKKNNDITRRKNDYKNNKKLILRFKTIQISEKCPPVPSSKQQPHFPAVVPPRHTGTGKYGTFSPLLGFDLTCLLTTLKNSLEFSTLTSSQQTT